jgi:23S rRNA (cytosine1962-C5)-methyltransferase
MYLNVILKVGKEQNIQRKHPWIFSGAIKNIDNRVEDGDIVRIINANKTFLGLGHFQSGSSIAIRIISYDDVTIDDEWWMQKLQNAYEYRKNLGFNPTTNAYRLFHGEGDGVSGLIIDIYNDIAVIQSHSIGVHKAIKSIALAINQIFKDNIHTVYSRCSDTLPEPYSQKVVNEFLFGNKGQTQILENNIKFYIDVETGQKTGFFLDQRDNRNILSTISEGKSVLNCFCYTGGFSMYSLHHGAKEVTSVDISQKAMDLVEKNISLNNFTQIHKSVCANVMHFLQDDTTGFYDIVIVDPPAFAKSLHKRHNAVQAYKRLNVLALKKVKSGGIIMTFSCSQVIGLQLFYDTIVSAGIESGRNIRVMRSLSQGADHPVNLFHPEGHYLKGLMIYVE